MTRRPVPFPARVAGTALARSRALHRAMREAIPEASEDRAYREAGEAELDLAPGRALTRRELVAALGSARAVVVGAFHTSPELPLALARLASDLMAGDRTPWTFLLPCFMDPPDSCLSGFTAGRLGPVELAAALDASDTWPFPAGPLVPLFELAAARRSRVKLAGLPSPLSDETGAAGKGRAAARGIRAALAGPGRVLALVGEHHLAPSRVGLLLGSEAATLVSCSLRCEEAAVRLATTPAGFELGPRLYAWVPAPPRRLFESFMAWVENAPELPWPLAAGWQDPGDLDLRHRLAVLQPMVSGALGFPDRGRLPAFRRVLSLDDLGKARLPARAREEVLAQVGQGRGYFLPGADTVVLGSADLGSAAEEVAHALHRAAGGEVETRDDPAEDFYLRVLAEAVGFAGSRAVVPDRPFRHGEEAEAPPGTALAVAIAALLVSSSGRHSLPDPDPAEVRRIYRYGVETYLAAAHVAGYQLGGWVSESPEAVRRLAALRPGPGVRGARAAYRAARELAEG